MTLTVNSILILKCRRTLLWEYEENAKKNTKLNFVYTERCSIIRIKWKYHFSHHLQRPNTTFKDNVEIYDIK